MLTHVEIGAGNVAILRPESQLALSNLVRRSQEYKSNRAYYGDVRATIAAICVAAHVDAAVAANAANAAQADALAVAAGAEPMALALAKALAAVCTKLAGLPAIVVESEGTDKARSFFSTTVNWEEMAQDVLHTVYEESAPMAQVFAVATRGLFDKFGPAWADVDETTLMLRRRRYLVPTGW